MWLCHVELLRSFNHIYFIFHSLLLCLLFQFLFFSCWEVPLFLIECFIFSIRICILIGLFTSYLCPDPILLSWILLQPACATRSDGKKVTFRLLATSWWNLFTLKPKLENFVSYHNTYFGRSLLRHADLFFMMLQRKHSNGVKKENNHTIILNPLLSHYTLPARIHWIKLYCLLLMSLVGSGLILQSIESQVLFWEKRWPSGHGEWP